MTIKAGPLFTDMSALASLKHADRGQAKAGDVDNLRKVARQFESLFTHMLMKNMRAASFGDGVFDSEQGKFYQDMFDQQMSTELSKGSGLGIAELLVRQLGQNKTVSPPTNESVHAGFALRGTAARADGAAPVSEESKQATGPVEFVRRMLPEAERIGRTLGIAPKFILAQAALETGWGSKPIRNADGSDSHNLFGIKAGSSWPGSRAIVDTLEFSAGVGRRLKAAFRSYASAAESFSDYARLLQGSPRYQDALRTGDDGAAFAVALQKGGYATDPDYAGKILRIADGATLENAMSVLK